jgi:hypothetical protein
MITTKRMRWLGASAVGVSLLYAVLAYPQKHMEEPITRDQLFHSLEKKLSASGLEHLIRRIEEWKVSFELTKADEQHIRTLQKHLDPKRVDALIGAIHNSRAPLEKEDKPAVAHIRFFVKEITPSSPETPYVIQVTIQTDLAFEPTILFILCDGVFESGSTEGGPSMQRDRREGYADSHTTYVVGFSSPPFAPESPLVIVLTSKSPIKVRAVERRFSY